MNNLRDLLNKKWAQTALSILAGFIVGAIVMALARINPFIAYFQLFMGVFSNPRYIVESVIGATPVIITGVAVALALEAGLFNIGAEGQFMAGAITASFLGYALHLPPFIHPLVVILGAAIIGSLYGGLVGFLKAAFGIHEVLSSIMLNWIAFYLNNWYAQIPAIHKPNTNGTWEIMPTAHINLMYIYKTSEEGLKTLQTTKGTWAEILLRTNINYGILIAIAIAIAARFLLKNTTIGFNLKAVGKSREAAKAAGINDKLSAFASMAISGAIAGVAGAVYLTSMGGFKISQLSMTENYGFNGLSVALIGGGGAIGCVFAGLFFGALNYGAGKLQSIMRVPKEIINITIGSIVFFVGAKTAFGKISLLRNVLTKPRKWRG